MVRTSRRAFAKTIAAAGAALPLLAQTPVPSTPPPAPAEPKPSELAKSLAEVVRAEYGAHLDRGELAKIEKDFEDDVPSLQRLRAFELSNSDQPDFTFHALRR